MSLDVGKLIEQPLSDSNKLSPDELTIRIAEIPSCLLSREDLEVLDESLRTVGDVTYTAEFRDQKIIRRDVKALLRSARDVTKVRMLSVTAQSENRQNEISIELNELQEKPNRMEIKGIEETWVNGKLEELRQFFRARKTSAYILYDGLFQLLLWGSFAGSSYFAILAWNVASGILIDWRMSFLAIFAGIFVGTKLKQLFPFANLRIGGVEERRLITSKGVVEGVVSGLLLWIILTLAWSIWTLVQGK